MIFKVYRRDSDWQQYIKAALIDFADRFQVAPVMVRVNRDELGLVTEILQSLNAPVPVEANGGTLLGELELGRKE